MARVMRVKGFVFPYLMESDRNSPEFELPPHWVALNVHHMAGYIIVWAQRNGND